LEEEEDKRPSTMKNVEIEVFCKTSSDLLMNAADNGKRLDRCIN
jgi:hypothetical protein